MMIERFYLKEYLSFKESEMELNSGLIVFSGPSGSGKSILMSAILSSLGVASCEAKLCESSVNWKLNSEEIGIENNDINVFKHIKKENSRFFINNQSLSKKTMTQVTSNYLRHLSLKDFSDFENENLLSILDAKVEKKDKTIIKIKKNYQNIYREYFIVKQELAKVIDEEKKIVELKEFTSFEIQKIEDINPKIGEDEELLKIKKELSKKEKVLESIKKAMGVFEYEYHISSALESLECESSFIDDAFNELRALLDSAEERFSALDEIDVEEVLNRIEALSSLKRRYGSIEETLIYKEEKQQELKKYENIESLRDELEQRYQKLHQELQESALALRELRKKQILVFEKDLNIYLKSLYLRDATLLLKDKDYTLDGKDSLEIMLNNTELSKISTGEFNRLRLAILALKSEFMNSSDGVLMLDEIDANLSGEESMSVAKVLRKLSRHFQIFVISHQPQLTSMGDQHFLVYKEGDTSKVKELKFDEKVDEIARIISGEKISQEARKFAKELLEANRCVL
jgi:DNA repair protein RecN (Recombination protein N)